MIYSIVGTNASLKDKALKELSKEGAVSHYLYSEHINDLEPLIDASSLFGDKLIVSCVSLLDNPSSRERTLELLPKMKDSGTVFIMDEPFLDAAKTTKLSKVSQVFYDVREEKKRDSSVFVLCLSFAKRDKKATWSDYMEVKKKEEGEAIAGALWWKWKEVWQATLEGKKTPYTLSECERIGEGLIKASLDAHRGKGDIDELLEKIILSI